MATAEGIQRGAHTRRAHTACLSLMSVRSLLPHVPSKHNHRATVLIVVFKCDVQKSGAFDGPHTQPGILREKCVAEVLLYGSPITAVAAVHFFCSTFGTIRPRCKLLLLYDTILLQSPTTTNSSSVGTAAVVAAATRGILLYVPPLLL